MQTKLLRVAAFTGSLAHWLADCLVPASNTPVTAVFCFCSFFSFFVYCYCFVVVIILQHYTMLTAHHP